MLKHNKKIFPLNIVDLKKIQKFEESVRLEFEATKDNWQDKGNNWGSTTFVKIFYIISLQDRTS